MTETIEATYVNGVLKPHKPLDLEEGVDVRLTILPVDEPDDPLAAVIGFCGDGPPISLAARHDEVSRIPIWQRALDLTANMPAEELDKLPRDGAAQLDHYLYGHPKRPE